MDKETHEARYFGLYMGTVIDDADPELLGRVRVSVPGILEGAVTPWAWPLGSPGAGAAQRGSFDVPAKTSDVYVQFVAGDPERPVYSPGHWGKPGGKTEAPTRVQGIDPADQSRVKVWEDEKWEIYRDARTGKEALLLSSKDAPEDLYVELDGHALALTLSGTTMVNIKAAGLVNIDGALVQIAGRQVIRNGKPIQ